MYNLVKDEYDSNIDDIIASVNKMINKTPSKIKKGKLKQIKKEKKYCKKKIFVLKF